MPKTKISEYSTTNALNTDIESINIDEGCAPSGINNAIRELMVHLKEFQTGASGDPLTVAGTFVASGSATLNGTSIPASKTLATTADTNTFTVPQIISANSSSDALRITQTGAGNALVVEDSTNPDSTPFVVDNTGRTKVGGTTNVTLSGFTGSFFDVLSAASAGGGGATYQQWSSDLYGAQQMYVKSRGGAIGTNGIVSSGDIVGMMRFYADDGASFIPAADIRVNVDGTPGTNDMPGRLVFSTTADGASSPTERMRITNAGNVGIGGTPAGSSQFNVLGTLVSASNISRGINSSGTAPTTSTTEVTGYFSNPSTADGIGAVTGVHHFYAFQGTITGGTRTAPTNQYGFRVDSNLTGATNNYGFYSNIASGTGRWNFYANGTAENYFAGNVGIATTSPGSALDVKGTLRLSGSSSGYVGLAPAAAAGSTTYTLPSADGTSGQVLSTNGSGTLSWETAGGGGSWVFLSSATASNSATVDLETTFSSTYETYVVVASNIVVGNDNAALGARLKIAGSYQTANYKWHSIGPTSNATTYVGYNNSSDGAMYMLNDLENNSGFANELVLYINEPTNSTNYKCIWGLGISWDQGNSQLQNQHFAGAYFGGTGAMTGIRFLCSAGNIVSGTFRLYGIKKS